AFELHADLLLTQDVAHGDLDDLHLCVIEALRPLQGFDRNSRAKRETKQRSVRVGCVAFVKVDQLHRARPRLLLRGLRCGGTLIAAGDAVEPAILRASCAIRKKPPSCAAASSPFCRGVRAQERTSKQSGMDTMNT